VPSLDENPWQVLVDQQDRSVLDDREDVLRFQTEPLAEPLVLAGPALLTITVSARGGAGSIHATLVDVWPGGPARRLSSGAALIGRESRAVRIDLGEICCRLDVGRSLRLDLACTDFPRHPRSSGVASPLTATRLVPGELRVKLGDEARLTFHGVQRTRSPAKVSGLRRSAPDPTGQAPNAPARLASRTSGRGDLRHQTP